MDKILIADDHGLIRRGLKQVLESDSDFIIKEASDGEQALDIIRKEKIDIAILDIEMPKFT